MGEHIQGKLDGTGKKIAIVVSRFNHFVTERLLAGALDRLSRFGAEEHSIDVVWVPGAFEIPLVAKTLAESGRFDGLLCLGAVIRGDTPHFDYVCSESAKGISQVMLSSALPVINGILTTNTVEQAIERAGLKSGNKGAECAEALVEMISVLKQIRE